MDEADVSPRDTAEYCRAMGGEFAGIMRQAGAEGVPLALALEHLQAVAEHYLRATRPSPPARETRA